jgi:hypothetical protein
MAENDDNDVGAGFGDVYVHPWLYQQDSNKKCECGADKVYGRETAKFAGYHAHWCPCYVQPIKIEENKYNGNG